MDLGIVCGRQEKEKLKETSMRLHSQQLAWANAFAARIFYDFSRDLDWINRVREKIQRKLATIRVSLFLLRH